MIGPEDMGDPEQRGGGRHTRRTEGGAGSGGGGQPTGPIAAAVPDEASDETPVTETPFDIWLSRSLHQMFDQVKDETIPPELLRLIEEDRARRRGG